ncbi:carboxymethylenebutenolidase [Malassezia cuniculi]|uniref:Carboxymethylenebutenolidase n=1 Tax=Malassezia cuniculi TaxID=948313 RepID=A0AAF0J7D1_9BASI|nr:carboxymethylenebutenolidase [Malassezia cuniculi]
MSSVNQACCTLKPVQVEYEPKGTYEEIGGLKTYVTGSKESKRAIIGMFDIFGFWPQTLQGADLLAEATKSLVVFPNFFRDNNWPIDGFPPRDEDEAKRFGEWLETIGEFGARLKDLQNTVDALKGEGFEKFGLYGTCWGAKAAVQASGANTQFSGLVQLHPAFVNVEDAKKLTIPVAFFPSRDEPKEDVDAFWAAVQANSSIASKSQFKYYTNMHHGWAAARADLKDEDNYFAFQDVYTRVAEFFNDVLA